jgi:hypothetical protein
MAKRNITLPFNFYCYTENPIGIYDEVNIIPLDKTLNLEKWWWKLTLFNKNKLGNGINLFLDLDIVIQDNIDYFFKKAKHNKITLISYDYDDHYVLPLDYDPKMAPAYNSSIMIWYNNELTNIYQKFLNNKIFFQSFYHGIDRFFTYEISSSNFLGLDNKDYYHRTIKRGNEIHEQSYFVRLHTPTEKFSRPARVEVFFNKNIPICVFNGCHEDDFYQGMENFLL